MSMAQKQYLEAAATIQYIIDQTRKREAAMMPTATLEIEKGKDGTYTVTVSREKGEKRVKKFKQDGQEHKETSQKKYRENKRVMKLGKLSQELREEKKVYSMRLRGWKEEIKEPTHNKEKRDEIKKTQKELSIGDVEISTTKATRSNGKKAARLNMRANLAKMEGRVVTSHREGIHRKESMNLGAKAEVLGGSITASAPVGQIGTHKATAEAHAITMTANMKELEASLSAGAKFSVGVQVTAEDISKKAALILLEESLKGSSANFTRVIDEIGAMFEKLGPSSGLDFGTINISAASLDLVEMKITKETQESEQEHEQEVSEQNMDIEQTNDFQVTIEYPIYNDIKEDHEQNTYHTQTVLDVINEINSGVVMEHSNQCGPVVDVDEPIVEDLDVDDQEFELYR